MKFSQTFGQTLENRPVISAEPSQGERDKTVPASALCAPSHYDPEANCSQPPPRPRQSYSQSARAVRKAWREPSCAAYE